MILVTTATSSYLVVPPRDGQPGTLTRTPGNGLPPADDPDDWCVADLRQDGENVELIALDRIETGRRATFVVRLYPDEHPELITTRMTTPVQAVEHLS